MLGVRLLSFAFFFPTQHSIYGDNEAPTLSVKFGDGGDNNGDPNEPALLAGSGDTLTLNADGGSTEPDNSQGRPPWTKTGNVRYNWTIEPVDGSVDMSVSDGDITAEPYITVYSDGPGGQNSVQVSYQEEYQDSSNPPNRVYWPE